MHTICAFCLARRAGLHLERKLDDATKIPSIFNILRQRLGDAWNETEKVLLAVLRTLLTSNLPKRTTHIKLPAVVAVGAGAASPLVAVVVVVVVVVIAQTVSCCVFFSCFLASSRFCCWFHRGNWSCRRRRSSIARLIVVCHAASCFCRVSYS